MVLAVPDTTNPPERTCHGQNHKQPPSLPPKKEETYITSEHSYQKPQSFGPDCKLIMGPMSSDEDDASSFEDDQESLLEDKNHLQYTSKEDSFHHQVNQLFVWITFLELFRKAKTVMQHPRDE